MCEYELCVFFFCLLYREDILFIKDINIWVAFLFIYHCAA